MSHSTIYASGNVQYLGKDLSTVLSQKNITNAIISMVKDENAEAIYIKICSKSGGKYANPFGFPIKELQLYDRFIDRGISTIKLPKSNVQIQISNCPPDNLKLFISTLRVKTKSQPTNPKVSNRQKLTLNTFETVSPIRKTDIKLIRNQKLTNHFATAPISPIVSRKRLISDSDDCMTPPRKVIKRHDSQITTKNDTLEFSTPPNKMSKLMHATSTPNRDGMKLSDMFKGESNNKVALKRCKTLDTSLNDSFELTENYKLSQEQIRILEKIRAGQNVFYTGSAGTGKTFLMKKIIRCLPPLTTAVTASTGVAASLISGCTLHAFAGLGAEPTDVKVSVQRIQAKTNLLNQWRKVTHLVIDEISLVSAAFFDHLDEVARKVRGNPMKPFGGIQLILCGDFCQLPPIIRDSSNHNYRFAFQSSAWNKAFDEVMELTLVHRQTDAEFVKMLNEIRLGRFPDWVRKKLDATKHQNIEKNGITATKLCTHKADVGDLNSSHLHNLTGEDRVFNAVDSHPDMAAKISQLCPVDVRLVLKIGAQVMLLRNIDIRSSLANGSRGVIIGFGEPKSKVGKGSRSWKSTDYPLVRFMSGAEVIIRPEVFTTTLSINGNRTVVTRTQVPLSLAYAISIHKSQGMTLDCAELHLLNVFESGQAYVALSRCRSLERMKVMTLPSASIKADRAVLKFYDIQKGPEGSFSFDFFD